MATDTALRVTVSRFSDLSLSVRDYFLNRETCRKSKSSILLPRLALLSAFHLQTAMLTRRCAREVFLRLRARGQRRGRWVWTDTGGMSGRIHCMIRSAIRRRSWGGMCCWGNRRSRLGTLDVLRIQHCSALSHARSLAVFPS